MNYVHCKTIIFMCFAHNSCHGARVFRQYKYICSWLDYNDGGLCAEYIYLQSCYICIWWGYTPVHTWLQLKTWYCWFMKIFVVCTVENLALRRPCSQSSIGWNGEANRAVDGNLNALWGGASCTHTQSQPGAWWMVDLGGNANIDHVKITNRADCCSKYHQQSWLL